MALTGRFEDALTFAFRTHQNQLRKGMSTPYVEHVLGVASIALNYGADEDEAIAALLHDAVEDQGGATMRAQILEQFGARVTAIVDGCTDTDQTLKPPWRARKEAYIHHIGSASPSVVLVSASDKLHNARAILKDLRTVGDELWNRFTGGKDGTLWYYRALVEAYRGRGHGALIDELDRAVTEIERLAGMSPDAPRA